MKIEINKDVCIGCGTCEALCPKVFKLNNDMKAEVIECADLNNPDLDLVIDSCPTSAIKKIA